MNVISTEKAPGAIGPYSQGFEVNGVIYTSGQIPVNPADGSVAEDIAGQAEQSCKNVGAILEAAALTRYLRPPASWQIWAILQHLTKYMLSISHPNQPGAVWQLRPFQRAFCVKSRQLLLNKD